MLNGLFVTGWVLIALCVLMLAVVVFYLVAWGRAGMLADAFESGPAIGLVCLGALAVIFGVSITFANWPLFDTSFHRNVEKSFYVRSIDSRVMNQTTVYAVTDMSDRTYKCVDTRCAVLRPFDHVTLSCLKQWQRHGTPGFDCDYVSARRAGR